MKQLVDENKNTSKVSNILKMYPQLVPAFFEIQVSVWIIHLSIDHACVYILIESTWNAECSLVEVIISMCVILAVYGVD